MDSLDKKVMAKLRELKSGTWKALADSLGHNQGLLWNVVNGKKSAPASLIVTLGLTPRMAPAPVCRKCGAVHVRVTCPNTRNMRPRYRRLSDMPPEVLAWKIQNREMV